MTYAIVPSCDRHTNEIPLIVPEWTPNAVNRLDCRSFVQLSWYWSSNIWNLSYLLACNNVYVTWRDLGVHLSSQCILRTDPAGPVRSPLSLLKPSAGHTHSPLHLPNVVSICDIIILVHFPKPDVTTRGVTASCAKTIWILSHGGEGFLGRLYWLPLCQSHVARWSNARGQPIDPLVFRICSHVWQKDITARFPPTL